MRETIVLGIETSCDETAAGLVARDAAGRGRILADVVRSQTDLHQVYGGVVPEIAARAHAECLDDLIRAALREAGVGFTDLAAVAATAGPGLIGGLLVGLTTGKAIALAHEKRFLAINHLEAHALTVGLTEGLAPPYMLLLVSGGHTQLLGVDGVGQYRRLGSTIDDALGEAFDKTAKLLGLGFPGGPAVEALARRGDPRRFDLPAPMIGRAEPHFSFAGLKTAVRHLVQSRTTLTDQDRADIAAAFEMAVARSVKDRVRRAMALEEGRSISPRHSLAFPPPPLAEGEAPPRRGEGSGVGGSQNASDGDSPPPQPSPTRGEGAEGLRQRRNGDVQHLVVAGGVAANQALRAALGEVAAERGWQLHVPPPKLCTDNGAMIAWAGAERLALGLVDGLDAPARARWPLDAAAAPVIGAGRHGAKA